ncbi:MAG: hypothetical protein IT449_10630 [Phycisphaerales bacterium]|nr:hypothetical protein [Phycisphaerales bacterium]
MTTAGGGSESRPTERLIAEVRSVSRGTTPAYDLEYVYDQGGNRLAKIDNIVSRRVLYTYDISAPTTYGSDNNRLMFYETYDTSGTPWVRLSTTWCGYNPQGNATRIVAESATPAKTAAQPDVSRNVMNARIAANNQTESIAKLLCSRV